MITVACVLRSGGVYNAEDVARLRDGVAAHLRNSHAFVCLSDVAVPCERIPLRHGWPGWWSKLELFLLPPPVLFFDLDTMMVGDLGDMAAQAALPQFTILRNFYVENGLGSGLMAWGKPMASLYERFAKDPGGWMNNIGGKGDQCFVEMSVDNDAVVRWQDVLPGQAVSYKAHVRGHGVPPDARAVCFHGKPKPRDIGWKL